MRRNALSAVILTVMVGLGNVFGNIINANLFLFYANIFFNVHM